MRMQIIDVKIKGIADIMFDRFYDHTKTPRPPEQKLYLVGTNQLVLPVDNLYSFLFGQDPAGCALRFEGKKGSDHLAIGQSHVFIDRGYIHFKHNGEKIKFDDFLDGSFWIHYGSGRTKQGRRSIKQEVKPRPVLRCPWSLSFKIQLAKNNLIDSTKLLTWFQTGGIILALGTYRPRFGRFVVKRWIEEE